MVDSVPPGRSRREKFAIGFMIVWIIFWTACMFVVIYGLVMALIARDTTPAAFMLFWLMAATFGLSKGIRALRQILLDGLGTPGPAGDIDWKDDRDRSDAPGGTGRLKR